MPLEDFIITVFCWVEEHLKSLLGDHRLRQRGFAPKLTDSEVITLEVVGEFLGLDTDVGIWKYFGRHWLSWFPELGSRTTFAQQAGESLGDQATTSSATADRLGGGDRPYSPRRWLSHAGVCAGPRLAMPMFSRDGRLRLLRGKKAVLLWTSWPPDDHIRWRDHGVDGDTGCR